MYAYRSRTLTSTARRDDSFEELPDFFRREGHRGVADVELESLQTRALGLIGAAEHPDAVGARDVEHSRLHGLARTRDTNVHHRALDGEGKDLHALDSIEHARDLDRAFVVLLEAITAKLQCAQRRGCVGPQSEGAAAVTDPPEFQLLDRLGVTGDAASRDRTESLVERDVHGVKESGDVGDRLGRRSGVVRRGLPE